MTYIPNIRKPNYSLRMQSVIDYAENESIPIPGRKFLTYLDRHVTDLDDRGSLVKLDSYHNFAGQADPAFKLINLVDPYTHEFVAYGGLIWDKDGVKGNGVNGYINTVTNLSNLTKYSLDDACRFGVVNYINELATHNTRYIWSTQNNIGNERYNLYDDNINRINSSNNNPTGTRISKNVVGLHYVERQQDDEILVIVKDNSQVQSSDSTTVQNSPINLIGKYDSLYTENGLSNFGQGKALGYANTQHLRASYNKFLKSILLPEIA